jgi:hypothetical protein
MDHSALASLLQGLLGAIAITISNIPYSKTILERNVIQSLNKDSNDNAQHTLNGPAWVSAVRSSAEHYASLSATDLMQISKEAGFHIELS